MSSFFKKLTVHILIFIFCIWILPLGVFLSAEESKLACDGQRAICMCPHLVAKQLDKIAERTGWQNPIRTNSEKSQSENLEWLILTLAKNYSPTDHFNSFVETFLYQNPNRLPLDGIPKA